VNGRELVVPDGPFSPFSLVSLNLAVYAYQVQGSTGIRLVIYLSSSSLSLCWPGLY